MPLLSLLPVSNNITVCKVQALLSNINDCWRSTYYQNCEVSVERSNDEFKNDVLQAKPANGKGRCLTL